METAIDKLKENVQSSIRDTKNLVKDLYNKLSKTDTFDPTWFSYFSTKVKADNRLRTLQKLQDTLK